MDLENQIQKEYSRREALFLGAAGLATLVFGCGNRDSAGAAELNKKNYPLLLLLNEEGQENPGHFGRIVAIANKNKSKIKEIAKGDFYWAPVWLDEKKVFYVHLAHCGHPYSQINLTIQNLKNEQTEVVDNFIINTTDAQENCKISPNQKWLAYYSPENKKIFKHPPGRRRFLSYQVLSVQIKAVNLTNGKIQTLYERPYHSHVLKMDWNKQKLEVQFYGRNRETKTFDLK